jgi:uncharacterized SAM-binding protein YcdF (DUF218 family)
MNQTKIERISGIDNRTKDKRNAIVTCRKLHRKFLLLVCMLPMVWFAFSLAANRGSEGTGKKADVIVLFVGPEREERKAEALRLAAAGYADWIMVPAYHQVYRVATGNGRDAFRRDFVPLGDAVRMQWRRRYPWFMEDTHFEALEARQLMAEKGFRSALLVSSPYHMWRIRYIARAVFGGGERQIACVTPRFDGGDTATKGDGGSCTWKLASEFCKLGWFFIYYPAVATQSG